MKKYIIIILGFLLLPSLAFAINITVPQAPSAGYGLLSTTTGAYVATTTSPWHVGSLWASSTSLSSYFGGRVGIGTTSPFATLSVQGQTRDVDANPISFAVYGGSSSDGSAWQGGSFIFRAGDGGLFTDIPTAGGIGGDITLQGGLSPTATTLSRDGFILLNARRGKVGIGSSTPWAQLSVSDADSPAPSLVGPLFAVGSTTGTDLVVRSNHNVGIGTSTPYTKLSVVGQVVGAYFTATTSTASTFPYASSTALTVNGIGYFNKSGMPTMLMGYPSFESTYGGLWITSSAPSGSNYTIIGDAADTFFNAPTTNLRFRIGNSEAYVVSVTSGFLGYDLYSTNGAILTNRSGNFYLDNLNASGGILMRPGNKTESARFTSSGNVSIGATSDTAKLFVKGSSASTLPTFQSASSTGAVDFQVDKRGVLGIGVKSAGIAVLSSGTVVVTPGVPIDSKTGFQLTTSGCSANIGSEYISATSSTTFTISSTNVLSACPVDWLLYQRQ